MRRVRWPKIAADAGARRAIRTLVSNSVELLNNCGSQDEINSELIRTHSDLFQELKKLFIKFIPKQPRTKKYSSTTWFDKECSKTKRVLFEAIKNKNHSQIRSCRKLYNEAKRKAKQKWDEERWLMLSEACDKRNMQQFWYLIKWGI
ncbi:hypothetical protein NDU88_001900 [Pleurodeles waltl]|uniref:Uncharacterized protein n=1 Tax=Pleurodeles waltl TaxID=8319 RepID=A0AAV7R8K3_PLEWA|nr:hypothetical protein NDU88_001900 [Pleurodeles waltl]